MPPLLVCNQHVSSMTSFLGAMIHSNVVEYPIKNKQNTGDKGWSPAQNRIELLDITGVTKKNRNILMLSQ